MSRLLVNHPHGGVAFWELWGRPCIVFRAARDSQGRVLKKPTNVAAVTDLLLQALAEEGLLVSRAGRLYTRVWDGAWAMVSDVHNFAAWLNHTLPIFCCRERILPDPAEIQHPNLESDDFVAAAHAVDEPQLELFSNPQTLIRFVQSTHWPGVPQVAGFLSHPVLHQPAEVERDWDKWIEPDWPDPAQDVDNYQRWRTLFSGHPDMPPWAHAALHVFVLGCLTSASLQFARPILFVDSWVRGRGKSEISRALALLLDGRDESVVISGRKTDQEVITSHLVSGRRTLVMHNLDGIKNYSSPFLVSLATDGGVGDRAKYDRETSYFGGVALTLNSVYGAASLHEDFISRVLRVELPGAAQQLSVVPQDFVRRHRNELLAEARHAWQHAQAHSEASATTLYAGPCYTRCDQFESAGALLYAEIFGKTHHEVSELMREATLQRLALTSAVMQNLFAFDSDVFDSPSERVVGRGLAPILPESWAGITALGKTFTGTGKEWA